MLNSTRHACKRDKHNQTMAEKARGRCYLPALARAIDCDDKVNDKSVVTEDGVEG